MADARLITKNSSTAGNAPGTNDILRGELALNLADKKLYSKDQNDVIFEVGSGTAANTLQQVTDTGNTTTNNILINSKIELKASDGSIIAEGTVDIGDNNGSSANTGFYFNPNGQVSVFTASNADAISIFSAGTNNVTINSSGASFFAGTAGIGGTSSAPNITLSNSGSITAAGNVSIDKYFISNNDDPAVGACYLFDISSSRTNDVALEISPTNSSDNATVRLDYNGDAEFRGDVAVGTKTTFRTIAAVIAAVDVLRSQS